MNDTMKKNKDAVIHDTYFIHNGNELTLMTSYDLEGEDAKHPHSVFEFDRDVAENATKAHGIVTSRGFENLEDATAVFEAMTDAYESFASLRVDLEIRWDETGEAV